MGNYLLVIISNHDRDKFKSYKASQFRNCRRPHNGGPVCYSCFNGYYNKKYYIYVRQDVFKIVRLTGFLKN